MSDGESVAAASAADVITAVRELRQRPATALVGIDGPSGSGKSSLAQQVSAACGVPVVDVDEFWTWGDSDHWWDSFVQVVLGPLVEGREARYRGRDWGRGDPGEPSGEPVPARCLQALSDEHLHALHEDDLSGPDPTHLNRDGRELDRSFFLA